MKFKIINIEYVFVYNSLPNCVCREVEWHATAVIFVRSGSAGLDNTSKSCPNGLTLEYFPNNPGDQPGTVLVRKCGSVVTGNRTVFETVHDAVPKFIIGRPRVMRNRKKKDRRPRKLWPARTRDRVIQYASVKYSVTGTGRLAFLHFCVFKNRERPLSLRRRTLRLRWSPAKTTVPIDNGLGRRRTTPRPTEPDNESRRWVRLGPWLTRLNGLRAP